MGPAAHRTGRCLPVELLPVGQLHYLPRPGDVERHPGIAQGQVRHVVPPQVLQAERAAAHRGRVPGPVTHTHPEGAGEATAGLHVAAVQIVADRVKAADADAIRRWALS